MLREKLATLPQQPPFVSSGFAHGFAKASDRETWQELLKSRLNQGRCQYICEQSDKLLNKAWPILPVSGYVEFATNGNRATFEQLYFERRRDFALLTLATCFTGNEKYAKAAANILWAMCEETSWAVPAHVERRNTEDRIPNFACPDVDLFACETAATLAEGAWLLADEFDSISPNLRHRLHNAINRRILEPYLQRDDFVWMSGHNNWTPWCLSSILIASNYIECDHQRLQKILKRALVPLDRYIEQYPDDGCEPEGPMYWTVSPGVLLLALEVLHDRTDGKLHIYDHPKIQAMGSYIRKMHLGNGWCYSYSDAYPKFGPLWAKAYRYGKRIGDKELCDFAWKGLCDWSQHKEPQPYLGFENGKRCAGDLLQAIRELFWMPSQHSLSDKSSRKVYWFPRSQLLVADSGNDIGPNFAMGTKGGHNGISHNHNDVGSFVLYSNGSPVIIDVGRSEYTRQTFTDERYKQWWNAGRGHNLLLIDGIEQPEGGRYMGELVDYRETEKNVSICWELAGSYPVDTGLLSWKRTLDLSLDDEKKFRVKEDIKLKSSLPIELAHFTPREIKCGQDSALLSWENSADVIFHWDATQVAVVIQETETKEDPLLEGWQGSLQKIRMIPQKPKTAYCWEYCFTIGK